MQYIEEIKIDSSGIAGIQQDINNSNDIHPIQIVREEDRITNERVEQWYNRAKDSMSGFQ